MRAALNKLAFSEHRNRVAEPAGGQAVGNVNCGFAFDKIVELLINAVFGNRVKRRRRFV